MSRYAWAATLPGVQSKHVYPALGDTPIARFADGQEGVISRGQLFDLGYTRHAIQTRLETGRLHRRYRGVYTVGHTRLSLRGEWIAAVLACGPGAVLSHAAAAALHDLRRVPSGPIDVSAPSRHRTPGIRCHFVRGGLEPGSVTVVDRILITSVERTRLDQAAALSPQRLRSMLEQSERLRALDGRRLEAVIAASPGHGGIARLRAALAEMSDEPPWTQSVTEQMFLELIRAAGLPEPSTNVVIEGELVDAVWQEHRLIVEIDGWDVHRTRRSFERDRQRDAKLVLHGWRIVRLTRRRLLDDSGGVVALLWGLLQASSGARAASPR